MAMVTVVWFDGVSFQRCKEEVAKEDQEAGKSKRWEGGRWQFLFKFINFFNVRGYPSKTTKGDLVKKFHTHTHTRTHHRKLVELAHVTVQCTAVSRSLAFQSQWPSKKCMRTEMVKASHWKRGPWWQLLETWWERCHEPINPRTVRKAKRIKKV